MEIKLTTDFILGNDDIKIKIDNINNDDFLDSNFIMEYKGTLGLQVYMMRYALDQMEVEYTYKETNGQININKYQERYSSNDFKSSFKFTFKAYELNKIEIRSPKLYRKYWIFFIESIQRNLSSKLLEFNLDNINIQGLIFENLKTPKYKEEIIDLLEKSYLTDPEKLKNEINDENLLEKGDEVMEKIVEQLNKNRKMKSLFQYIPSYLELDGKINLKDGKYCLPDITI